MYYAAHKVIAAGPGYGNCSYTPYPSKADYDEFMNGKMLDGTDRPMREVYRCFAESENEEEVKSVLFSAWRGEIVV